MRQNQGLTAIILGALALAGMTFILRGQGKPAGRATQDTEYTAPETCAVCHAKIAETYQRTGMGRSFYRPSPANTVEDYSLKNTYFHKPSDSYFTMLRRDGKYYQRRHQTDPEGKVVNVVEKQIDYILGSGNHSRAYLHRTARNTLIELPLAWYSENGGYWAMNPGYDRPDHDGFRRAISYACIFCHNAYPQIPPGHDKSMAEPVYVGALPEGIDCQRCHGPGGQHAQLAKTAGAGREEIRNAIVNPSRLSPQRQAEVCMQCHLETTSFPLPNALQRYDRGPFSFKPGEPLSNFIVFFDHAAGKGRDDKYEIVNSFYRMQRSACFLQSKGKLRCTTCHNPHDVPRGQDAARHYEAVCRQCHSSGFDKQVAAGKHPRPAGGCIDCHMPKRRTEDVIHVVMTDHYIQRLNRAGDLLAERVERHQTDSTAYRGEVALYYPEKLPHSAENDLNLAIAQVIEKSNLRAGIAQLSAAIERYSPGGAEYYLELGEALRNNGELEKALRYFRQAVERNPNFVPALQKLGTALRRSGQPTEAAGVLKRTVTLAPDNSTAWHELGMTYWALNQKPDAVAALEKAVALDPDMSEAHNNLGVIWFAGGERVRAESAFRSAIRIQPNYADAHGNLGNLLSAAGDLKGAQYEFEIALRLSPNDATTRYNYATLLGRARRYDEAQHELETALRVNPDIADAHQLLADLLMARGQSAAAIPHYREALRLLPDFGRASLGLGVALASAGDVAGAMPHLRKAAADSDPAVREQAAQVLLQIGK